MTEHNHAYVNRLCTAVERKQCINMEGHQGDHNWAVDTTVEVLTADVRWLMGKLADQSEVVYRVPEHLCGFEVAPETGHCEFHERWFDAAGHVGLLDEWAAEDLVNLEHQEYDPVEFHLKQASDRSEQLRQKSEHNEV